MRYADSFCTNTSTDTHYVFTGPCHATKKPYTVRVPKEALHKYRHGGMFIQDAMPMLSAEDREFLMSGISPEGWALTFPEGEDEQ